MECLGLPVMEKIKEEVVKQKIKQEEENFELIEEESEMSDETKADSCQVEEDMLEIERRDSRDEICQNKVPEFAFVKVDPIWDECEEQELDSLTTPPVENIILEPQCLEKHVTAKDPISTSSHEADFGKFKTDEKDWTKSQQQDTIRNPLIAGKSANDFSFVTTDVFNPSNLESAVENVEKYEKGDHSKAHKQSTITKHTHSERIQYSPLERRRELARTRNRKCREKKRLENIKSSDEERLQENKDSRLERRRELARERIKKHREKKQLVKSVKKKPTVADVNEDIILQRSRELAKERKSRYLEKKRPMKCNEEVPAVVEQKDSELERRRELARINFKVLFSKECLSDLEYIKWLQELNLITKMYHCPKCPMEMTMGRNNSSTDGFIWRCPKCKSCRSIRKGSWFENSKLTLKNIMLLSYMWCERYSQRYIRKEMKLSTATLTDWINFCRENLYMIMENDFEVLGGPGKIVEIYASLDGNRMYSKRRQKKCQQWVFGGVEQGSNKCFVKKVDAKNAKTLIPIFEKYILPGTTIYSDYWKAYDSLGKKGYNYLQVNRKINFKNGEVSSNAIEELWQHVKSAYPECTRRKLLFDSYLGEYMFRIRHSSEDIFQIFLENIVVMYKPKSSDFDDGDSAEEETDDYGR